MRSNIATTRESILAPSLYALNLLSLVHSKDTPNTLRILFYYDSIRIKNTHVILKACLHLRRNITPCHLTNGDNHPERVRSRSVTGGSNSVYLCVYMCVSRHITEPHTRNNTPEFRCSLTHCSFGTNSFEAIALE